MFPHKHHETPQERKDLIGEHPSGDVGQIILGCLFAATWIVDTFYFEYTTFLNRYWPLGFRIPIGMVLLILAGGVVGSNLHS
jgi:hypothetical protein